MCLQHLILRNWITFNQRFQTINILINRINIALKFAPVKIKLKNSKMEQHPLKTSRGAKNCCEYNCHTAGHILLIISTIGFLRVITITWILSSFHWCKSIVAEYLEERQSIVRTVVIYLMLHISSRKWQFIGDKFLETCLMWGCVTLKSVILHHNIFGKWHSDFFKTSFSYQLEIVYLVIKSKLK